MIITFGRQHGSNGHDIARLLASELGYKCYDKEIVDHVAENYQLSKEILDSYDEKHVSNYIIPTPHIMGFNAYYQLTFKIANAQFETIRLLADKGNSIFVGRCADYVLRNRNDVVRVFIMANRDFRIETISKRQGITLDQARKLIRDVDKDRAKYYNYYSDQIWGDSSNYDLCIDSSRIGVEGAAKVIKSYIESVK